MFYLASNSSGPKHFSFRGEHSTTCLYPPLESADSHRLQHIAAVKFRLEKERNFRASPFKKYKRSVNIVDGIDTALAMTSVGLAASGI